MTDRPIPKPWHPAPYDEFDIASVKAFFDGKADERGQQRLRVRCQIGIAAKLLKHEADKSLDPRRKMLAAHIVNEDARRLRYAFRQDRP